MILNSFHNFRKIGNDFKKWKANRMAEYQNELKKQEQKIDQEKVSKAKAPTDPAVVKQVI